MTDLNTALSLIALGILCGVGVLITAVRMPGTWLIVLGAVGFGWWTKWTDLSVTMVAIVVSIAIVAEVLELLMSVFTAKKVGASRKAAWGGFIGGLAGMVLLSVPIPVIGIVLGSLFGCFLGAAIGELLARKKIAQGAKVGLFSAIGFALGTATKMALAMTMAGLVLTSAMCNSIQADSPQTGDASITSEQIEAQHD